MVSQLGYTIREEQVERLRALEAELGRPLDCHDELSLGCVVLQKTMPPKVLLVSNQGGYWGFPKGYFCAFALLSDR